ncbi:MAG: fibronectin type III domain-containing protein [Ilumatobacter sp.]
MALSYHIIIPLPNGRTGSTGNLSVFFVPRLQEAGKLADWMQDWRNWPKVINGTAPGGAGPLELRVALATAAGNFTVAPVNQGIKVGDPNWISAAPSEAAWDALFATNTMSSIRVDRFRPIVHPEDDSIAPMYDAQKVVSDVPEMYKDLAVDFPTSPPSVEDLAGVSAYTGFRDSGVIEAYDEHMDRPGGVDPDPVPGGAPSPDDDPESADFHAALAFAQAHPELLRSLGLVVDLEVTLAAGRTRLTVGSNYSVGYPGATVSVDVSFDTEFWPVDGPGSWPTVGDGSHSIGSVDIGPAITDTSQIVDGLDDDRSAGVSPMREDGVYLVRNGVDLVAEVYALWEAQIELEEQIKNYLVSTDPDPIPLSGEALVSGRRYDVFDNAPAQWFSIWDRIVPSGFDFPRDPALSITPPRDEGWMTYTAMSDVASIMDDPGGNVDPPQTGEGLVVAPPRLDRTPLRFDPKIFGWNGWSNVANPPGRAFCGVTGATDLADSIPTDDMEIQVGVDYAVPNSVLPRLRYGREYKFRARVVDLAGNSRDLSETHPGGNTETELHRYGRTKPLGAPVPVRRVPKAVPGVGDAPTTCVIKSELDQDDATVEPTSRVIFPSQTEQFQCELHGYPGPDGLFTDQATFDMVVARTAVTVLDDTEEDPDSGELMSPVESWRPDVSYLVEPAFDGFALLDLPGAAGATTLSISDVWPEARAIGVEVRAGTAAPVPRPNATFGSDLIVEVPKGITREIFATQRPSAALVSHWRLLQLVSGGPRSRMEAEARSGAHWMFSSRQPMKLIHAVRRPLSLPAVSGLGVNRSLNDTRAWFDGDLQIDVKSTGTVDFAATLADVVDTPGSLSGIVETTTTRFFFTQTEDYTEQDVVPIDETRFEVGDTKVHDIVLTLDAFTRYARHFTERKVIQFDVRSGLEVLSTDGVSDLNISVVTTGADPIVGRPNVDFTIDHEAGTITRTPTSALPLQTDINVDFIRLPLDRLSDEAGATIKLTIPNSGVPAVPGLVEALPAFARTRATQGDEVSVEHRGQTIRIWLRRPWFTTGAGETLGVVIGEGEEGPLSQAARDPLSTSGPTAPLTVDDFPEATVIRTGIGPLALDIAGHDVSFDADRNEWYSDIVISANMGYRPMVKLSLVRLQPVSIAGAFISPSITTEPIRLGADRRASITRNGDDIDVSVAGTELGNTMTARLQFSDPDIADANLSWKDLGTPVVLAKGSSGSNTVWSGSITAPESEDPVRVLIEDSEDLDGGPSIVYVETIPVPASWVGVDGGPLEIDDLTAQGGHEAALAKWSEPNRSVTGYRLERSDAGGPWGNGVDLTPNRTKYITRRLTNGVNYSFRVRATDASGDGPWSEPADTVPEITPPARVRRVTAVSGAGSVEVEWKAVATRGAVLTAYVVEQRSPSGDWGNPIVVGGTTTNATISGLADGTTVGVRVRAENAAGAGEWSNQTSVTVVGGGTVPAQVHGVNVASIASGVSATWQPADDGGAALNGYQVQVRPLGGAWGSTQSLKPEVLVAQFTGLKAKSVYEVRVRARNVVGAGDWSDAGVGSAGA